MRRPHRLARACIVATAAVFLLPFVFSAAGSAQSPQRHLYVSPGGSSASSCTRANPCRSLGRAFRLAAPGQVVELLSGRYPGQTIGGAPKSSPTHVMFRPARGASVSFGGRLTLDGSNHITLSRLRLARAGANDRSLFIDSCTTDVTFDHVSGETFFIMEGTRRITFRGGSWGGYKTPGEEDSAIGTSDATGPGNRCGGKLARPASGILFYRVTFHDVFWNVPSSRWGSSHPDCFEINGYVDGVTIRNSRFLRCASTFMQINGDQGDMSNVTFEGNLYSQLGGDTWYGIMITSEGKPGKCGNIVSRRNTYLPESPHASTWPNGPIRTDCEAVPGTSRVKVTGNLFARAPQGNECRRYLASPYVTSWTRNMFGSGSCGAASRHVPFGYALGSAGLRPSSSAQAVRLVFALAAQGQRHAAIIRELKRRQLAAPSAGWTHKTLDALVSDSVYAGGAYGAPGSQPRLVSAKRWRAAQRLVKR